MKPSSKRILSLGLVIIMFLASLFVYSSLIRPVYSEIKTQRAEIASRLETINKQQSSIAEVQKILADYQNVSQLQETISLIVPLDQNTPYGVYQLASLAGLNALETNSLSVQQLAITPSSQPGLVKGIGNLRFNLQLTGSYESFKNFIQALETNLSLMDVSAIKMEPPATKSAKGNFLYTITVNSYYQAK